MKRPIEKVIDALAAHNCRMKKQGSGVQCQCPAHDDKKESLSVKEDADGKVLMKCFAGCATGDVLRTIGLNFEALFPNESKSSLDAPKERKRITKTYPYVDEDGLLLYEVLRYEPKSFSQRRPDPNRAGKYIYKLDDVRRVPYRLPEVKLAIKAGKPVFFVEGEKDADNVARLGICSTTSAMGAGNWKKALYAHFFKGADVVLVPDNDDSGMKMMQNIALDLFDIAKSIRILNLPLGKPGNKKDVSDWLEADKSNDANALLQLAFAAPLIDVPAIEDMQEALRDSEDDEEDLANASNFKVDGTSIIYEDTESRIYPITDFTIEIQSIVHDDQRGRIYYIKVIGVEKRRKYITETIEILPETLDDLRAFSKQIRPYSNGEIFQYKELKVKPLRIFKWLLDNFRKPIVRRPDHVGYTYDEQTKQPFWIFGNAVVVPGFKGVAGRIVHSNDQGEFIIDEYKGFTLPLYKDNTEKELLTPIIDTNLEDVDYFASQVHDNYIELVGGGDETGRARHLARLGLAYAFYHLYDNELWRANDINGHTVMLYVYGEKGSGKTTYFNTIIKAFWGLHRTKEVKGNVSVAGLENAMGMYSSLPLGYDEYNPETSDVRLIHINGYYHKTSRTVSDKDRQGRNKYTPIRSTLVFTSNFRINLEIDQADATESRVIYFQYRKKYRAERPELFRFFQNNMNQLSRITASLIVRQTDHNRKRIVEFAEELYRDYAKRIDQVSAQNPDRYEVEHRLTDNYTRLLAVYESIYGYNKEFREFIFNELMARFVDTKVNKAENQILQQIAYLASEGRVKQAQHYLYNIGRHELYIHLDTLYETYSEFRREKAVQKNAFKDAFTDYFTKLGGFDVGTKKWNGSYLDRNHHLVKVNMAKWSYTISFDAVRASNGFIEQVFPVGDDEILLATLNRKPTQAQEALGTSADVDRIF